MPRHRRGVTRAALAGALLVLLTVTVLQEGKVLVEGTPAEIKTNAKVQEAYLGGVHGEMA